MINPTEFGLTTDETKNLKDIKPTYDLSSLKVGDVAKFQILEDHPRKVTIHTEKNLSEERLVIDVLDTDMGMANTLWLSSKSLRMEFFKLAEKNNGKLKDLRIRVGVRQYQHKQFGEVKAYIVQQI